MKTLREETEMALNHMPWLQDAEYAPLRAQLVMLADDYDLSRQTSTSAAWGLAYRFALSLAPQEEAPEAPIDPLEEILMRGVSV